MGVDAPPRLDVTADDRGLTVQLPSSGWWGAPEPIRITLHSVRWRNVEVVLHQVTEVLVSLDASSPVQLAMVVAVTPEGGGARVEPMMRRHEADWLAARLRDRLLLAESLRDDTGGLQG